MPPRKPFIAIAAVAIALACFAGTAAALDHTIGAAACSNPDCDCNPCLCSPCACTIASQPARGTSRYATDQEGQRFILCVGQQANTQSYFRDLARDNGYRFWSRQPHQRLPAGVYEAEVVNGDLRFSEPRITARPQARLASYAAQPSQNSVTYRVVGSSAAPQGYTCGPNGCFPTASYYAPQYSYSPQYSYAGSACESGSCGASSFGGGGFMSSGWGGGGGCASCR